jgi:hypothetical protein
MIFHPVLSHYLCKNLKSKMGMVSSPMLNSQNYQKGGEATMKEKNKT